MKNKMLLNKALHNCILLLKIGLYSLTNFLAVCNDILSKKDRYKIMINGDLKYPVWS